MDAITHFVSAALLSKSGFGIKYGRAVAFALVGGAIFPDSDVFLLFINRYFAYKQHRGLTHSFVGLLIFPFIIAVPIYFFGKYKKYWHLVGLFSLGMFVHIMLDWSGSWGTQILYPFTDKRYGLGFISFVDFYFSLLILIFLFISVRAKDKGLKVARIGLAVLAVYISMCIAGHYIAIAQFKNALNENHTNPSRILVMPRARTGPIGWRGLAETQNSIYRSERFILFSNPIELKEYRKEPVNKYVEKASKIKEVKLFLWFAEYPLFRTIRSQNKYIIKIWDLRYREPANDRPGMGYIQISLDDNGNLLDILAFE